jgi:gluconate kinase
LVEQAIKRKQAAREFFRLANGDPLKDAERETILSDIQTVPEEKIRQRNNLAFLFETLKRKQDEAAGKPTLETQVTEIHFALQKQINELKKEITTLKGEQPDGQENTQAKKK